jgi:hypothetical protein
LIYLKLDWNALRAGGRGNTLCCEILKLSPQTEAQRFLQARAMDAINDAGKTRLLLFTNRGGSISIPFLIVLISWLTLIFASFSLFAERRRYIGRRGRTWK